MYAGFWKRFFAFLIDSIIIFIIYILSLVLLIFAFMNDSSKYMLNIYYMLFYLFSFSLTILYWTIFECSSWQATPGKKALGIKVADMQGNRLSFLHSLRRNLCKIVSNFTFYVGYVMAGFTVRRQALHDKMSSCLVIDKNADGGLLQPLPKASPVTVIVAVSAVLIPVFLMILGVLAAIIVPSVIMAGSRIESSKAIKYMSSIKQIQQYYQIEKGVYASSVQELLNFKLGLASADYGPDLKNDADFTYNFLPSAISGKYNKYPGYTLTFCYDSDVKCIDVKSSQFEKLKIAAPQECCIKEK